MDLKALKEKVIAAGLKALDEVIKPAVEIEVEKLIEAKSDKVVDIVFAKLKEVIPGNFEDGFVEKYAPKVKADVKAALLAEAEKISDKV